VGVDAVAAAAVGDDLTVRRHFAEATAQFANRDRHRIGEVTAVVLLSRPDVDDERWRLVA
jgi:hypothetical protein